VIVFAVAAIVLHTAPTTQLTSQLAQTSNPLWGTSAGGSSRAAVKPKPVRLRIPVIGVNTSLMRLGLNRDRTLQVPPNAYTAGWFTGGPIPGQIGPAVIAAHVHWNGRDGVFSRLGQMQVGDLITVTREHASPAVFQVTRVSVFHKRAFPSRLVYGNVNFAALRLITCDGFNAATHTYQDNLVVFAKLVT